MAKFRAALSGTIIALNILVIAVVIVSPIALIKFLLPFPRIQKPLREIISFLSKTWSMVNSWVVTRIGRLKIDLEIVGNINLNPQGKYVVISNHQSASDIFILYAILDQRTKFPSYFIKWELLFFPVFGPIWYSLDFPFMKRHSREYLQKHPEQSGKDYETTIKFCSKMRAHPYCVINFSEGTRKTDYKMEKTKSPYKFLLPPKAGGLAVTLDAMNQTFDHLVDATIYYPGTHITFWDLVFGRIGSVKIVLREIPKSEIPQGDYVRDTAYQKKFQEWVNQIWRQKDQIMVQLEQKARHSISQSVQAPSSPLRDRPDAVSRPQ